MSVMSWLKNMLSPSATTARHRADVSPTSSRGDFSFGDSYAPSVVTPVETQPGGTSEDDDSTVETLPEFDDTDLDSISSETSQEALRVQDLADKAERYIERNDG